MEQEVLELVLKNGLVVVIMALIVMTLVGIVKIFTKGVVERKLVTETQKSWLSKLYLFLALVFSFVVVILYHWLILKVSPWTLTMVQESGKVWVVTTPLYQIYKQFGGRQLLVAIAKLFAKAFKGKNKDVDSFIELVMIVLEQDAPYLTDAQKETIKNDLTEKVKAE